MQSSGARMVWFSVVARKIMDGGTNPPSFDSLCLTVPGEITTAINDGHCTAAKVYGENRRDDFRAGQKFFIREVLDILRAQGLIGGDDNGFTWLQSPDGVWPVEVDGTSYSIYGQEERRQSDERNMLGETNEDGITDIPAGMFMRGTAQPHEIQVIGAHGRVLKEVRKFQVHPLALTIPPMTAQEREILRKSIAEHGVDVPIVIYQDKILDGRHRFYFAVMLKKPIRIEEFKGTEQEAKLKVARLNLHRRHLTVTQQTLTAIAMFGEDARKQTREAQKKATIEGNKTRHQFGGGAPELATKKEGPRYEEIVAKNAQNIGMTVVTPHYVKSLKGIERAPETRKRIDDGQLGRPRDARDAINTELHRNKVQHSSPKEPFEPAYIRSVGVRMVEARNHLIAIATDDKMPLGNLAATEIIERLKEFDNLVRNAIRTLRHRCN